MSADEIRKIILKMADKRGPERAFYASDVARAVDKDNWQDLMGQVRFVADVLIREGKIKEVEAGEEAWSMNEGAPVCFVKVS